MAVKLVFIILLAAFVQSASGDSCSLGISKKVDCGYFGIDEGQCGVRGCCWQPTQENQDHDIPWCYYQKPPQRCQVSGSLIDCGYVGIDQQICEDKGCCWKPGQEGSSTPWCFFPEDQQSQYKAVSMANSKNKMEGLLKIINGQFPNLGKDVDTLKVLVEMESTDRLHIRLVDAENSRWEIPQSYVPTNPASNSPKDQLYSVYYMESPFGITVKRKSNNETIFSTENAQLVYKDQYLEWTTSIPSSANLYGLGESTQSGGILLPRSNNLPKIMTMWNRDQSAHWTNQNLYGSHPFLMDLRADSGNAHGIFLRNSNGMDVVLAEQSVTYRVIGGVLDFYIFLGPSPEQVMQQYTTLIGTPMLPAYWALGFHQCKYGYKNIQEVEEVVKSYSQADIPLETIWLDIDHMDLKKDFTLDPVNYPPDQVKVFVDNLHKQNQKIVPIVDPGIAVSVGYTPYDDGVVDEIFLQQKDANYFIGQVWPGPVHFPDFMHPKSLAYWEKQLNRFKTELLDFDGIWIDMNEVSNFCSGSCAIPSGAVKQITSCYLYCSEPHNDLQDPPYKIFNGGQQKLPLYSRTMSMDLVHYGNVMEYNVHNLYGLMEAQATHAALQNITGTRAFVLTRSTFSGSGAYAAHWTGDIGSTWSDLQWSVTGVLNSNLFGMPFAGVDICGFLGTTTEELCRRWIQAAAFYPFSRDHSDINGGNQELYRWPKVAEAARNNLGLRYRLLPYLYTLFYKANEFGGSVMRPLFFEFQKDVKTHNMIDQYMWGSHILICPILEQGSTEKSAWFPEGSWYGLWDFQRYDGPKQVDLQGEWLEYKTPVFLRGGGIVPMQYNDSTITASRQNPFIIMAALNEQGTAEGEFYWDDGETIQPQEWLYSKFKAGNNDLQGSIFVDELKLGPKNVDSIPVVDNMVLFGVEHNVDSVYVNKVQISSAEFAYDPSSQMLVVLHLELDWRTKWQISWHSNSPANMNVIVQA
eukprot:TRINITY_DN4274_c1_g1_i1.p1 TRINITY_DN4274_c1_g1~~TRINITY_DN4274_c1_g1_i1.p1  ORF type:complete len:981 (+),score=174.94 TRINITY_DN4274_c1_g1_i1:29-2944(+)